MSDGQFIYDLREIINSERILSCITLIKADVNFWNKGLTADKHTLEGKNEIFLMYLVKVWMKKETKLLIVV